MKAAAVVLAATALVSCGLAPLQAKDVVPARVTYVTGSSVYVSAGREDGLTLGRQLEIRRGAELVATAEVTEVSTHRASCRIVDRFLDPMVGDTTSFEREETAPAATVAPEGEQATAAPPRRSGGAGVHGRVGLRVLSVDDRVDANGGYSQPALDLRLGRPALAGSPWGFSIDARSRRTLRTTSEGLDDDDTRTRVYSAAITWRGNEPLTLTAGRQVAPSLAAVSIFDGVSFEYLRERWSMGLISGSQPDASDYGYSRDIIEHGAYVTFHEAEGTRTRWSVTTGLIGSYTESEVNREFLYFQGRVSNRRLTAYLTQEVDYNRGWKTDLGEETLSVTGTFATLSYLTGSRVTLHAGYDNRRNVRLHRDKETPETEFDDSFRRGARAGVTVAATSRFRFGLDAWISSRDEEGDATTYTATAGARRIAAGHVDLNARATRYDNDRVEGWLYAGGLGAPLGARSYLRAEGGVRDETALIGLTGNRTEHWFGLDADFSLDRRWYLSVSVERTSGEIDEVDVLYTSITYRF